MKNRLLILSIFAAMSTASIHAQEPVKLKVNIPFGFHVGPTAMPAGVYNLQNGRAARGMLTVTSPTGEVAGVNIGTIPNTTAHAPKSGKLVFHKYGGDYFLYQVWSPESTAVATLPACAQEREMIAKGKNPDQTILAARRR